MIKQEKLNISATTDKFGVSYYKLRRRYLRHRSKSIRPLTNRKLLNKQEAILVAYLRRLDAIGLYTRPPIVKAAANSILACYYKDSITLPPSIGPY